MERKRIERLFAQLQKQPTCRFPKAGDELVAPAEHGVYVIRDRRNKVVHVGRTVRGRKGISQRLYNHLRGQSSFVNAHLDGHGERLRTGYTFQFLKVADDRERALLEYFATARLCPVHLGLGALRNAGGTGLR